MSKPDAKDEKDLEKLAKALLSTPHKPREESKVGNRKIRKADVPPTAIERVQIQPVALAPGADGWPSLGSQAMGHHSDSRSGPAAVQAHPVCSGWSRASDAAAAMAGSRQVLGPPKARRGSQRRSASDGPSGGLLCQATP